MLKNIDTLKIADESSLNILRLYGYDGENNVYDIIEFFEKKLAVYFNRIVEVDTDDDDFYPKNFVSYKYESVYQPSWSCHHTLTETNWEDERVALRMCVEYTIDSYHEYMVEMDMGNDEEDAVFFLNNAAKQKPIVDEIELANGIRKVL